VSFFEKIPSSPHGKGAVALPNPNAKVLAEAEHGAGFFRAFVRRLSLSRMFSAVI
jgi:hypothetical protein